jgi:hypothetical protein
MVGGGPLLTSCQLRFSVSTVDLSKFLRAVLRTDAALTGLSGLGLAAALSPLHRITGLPRAIEYGLVVLMLTWCIVVAILSCAPAVRRVGVGVAAANIALTIVAVVVVVIGLWPLTATGVALTLASGVYTFAFAVLQYIGVRRLR